MYRAKRASEDKVLRRLRCWILESRRLFAMALAPSMPTVVAVSGKLYILLGNESKHTVDDEHAKLGRRQSL